MNFPGTNKLVLSDAAICAALEGALNAARLEGEDYVRVLDIQHASYSTDDWRVTITTDVPAASVVVSLSEAA